MGPENPPRRFFLGRPPVEQRILGQITKLLQGGLLLYGWKKTGTTDPSDEDSVFFISGGGPGDSLPPPSSDVEVAPGVSWVPVNDDVLWLPYGTEGPEGYEPWMMYMSVVGQTKSGDKRGRWGQCYTCLEEFPLTEMTKIKGHWYCSKNKCKEDFE